MWYDSFMNKTYAAEYLNQNDDDMFCVTGVTGITGTSILLKII